MKVIVGLGNPGKKYQKTRHNIGFMILDDLAESLNSSFKVETKLHAAIAIYHHQGEKIVLVKPLTFMNLSGQAVAKVLDYYQVDLKDLCVISDDAALPVGKIRIRAQGGHGGQNGLRNIIEHLGTNDFLRMRLGIGDGQSSSLTNHVLGQFSKADQKIIDEAIVQVKDAVIDFINNQSVEYVMTKYNTQT